VDEDEDEDEDEDDARTSRFVLVAIRATRATRMTTDGN
jgi:hypothetical protein